MATELREIGNQIQFDVGRVTITLQWVRDGAYSVTAYQGTLRRDEWCKSWPTENNARGWASMVVAMARIDQREPQPCGCRGVGWICTGAMWYPCVMCNAGEATPFPVTLLSE